MARDIAPIADAVLALFAELDAGGWDALAERLDPNVELADELTSEWLRGERNVAAYLGALPGVVSELRSEVSSLRCRWLADDVGFATFVVRHDYRLDGVARTESLIGSAAFSFDSDEESLLVLHLGKPADPRAGGQEEDAAIESMLETEDADVLGEEGLGAAIRCYREKKGLSLRELSRRTGLSPGFVSQLERGHARPSLQSLSRIALALDVQIARLFGPPTELLPPAKRTALEEGKGDGHGFSVESFSPRRPASELDVRFWTLPPGGDSGERLARCDELLTVISGRLRITHAATIIDLGPTDSLYLTRGARHRFYASGTESVRVLTARRAVESARAARTTRSSERARR